MNVSNFFKLLLHFLSDSYESLAHIMLSTTSGKLWGFEIPSDNTGNVEFNCSWKFLNNRLIIDIQS